MTSAHEPIDLSARDNPLLVKLRRLQRDGAAYRKLGVVWLEGDHLCRALLARGRRPAQALISRSGWNDPALRGLALQAPKVARLDDALFADVSALESPGRIGFVLDHVSTAAARPRVATLVLDRVQDAGNAGSMLRSAAAFGVTQVIALKGSVALWSAKVLRAGMGAHFALDLVEGAGAASLDALDVPLVATSSHDGELLGRAALPGACAWVFGNEGQGVDDELLARCTHRVRIPQPGGEESLNVAAAAAVCLYETVRRRKG
jgi:TrmH family RNA methyltransferase